MDPGVVQSEDRDLGFGSVVSRQSRRRLLNRDGSFNVVREGLPWGASLSLYHRLLELTWPRFLLLTAGVFLGTNLLFALGYFALGPEALTPIPGVAPDERFLADFFFSVQTLSTIGYGTVAPATLGANLLVTLEALTGLLGFALVTGLVFARFSRPTARILFGGEAVIAPYRGGTALELRIANARRSQLIEVEAKLVLTRFRPDGMREYFQLALERDRVAVFPLTWTIVHPIDENSPLRGVGADELVASHAEVLVLLTGYDESFAQTVHARSSYAAGEIVFGRRFVSAFLPPAEDGILRVDVRRLGGTEPATGGEPQSGGPTRTP